MTLQKISLNKGSNTIFKMAALMLIIVAGGFFVRHRQAAAQAGQSDLVVESLSYWDSNILYAGFPFDGTMAYLRVKNQGQATATHFEVQLYVMDASTNFTQCGSAQVIDTLGAGESKNIEFTHDSFFYCANLENKNYYLRAFVDYNQQINESDENNNTKETPVFTALPESQAPQISGVSVEHLSNEKTRINFSVNGSVNPIVRWVAGTELSPIPSHNKYDHQQSAVNAGGKYYVDLEKMTPGSGATYHYRILSDSHYNVTTKDASFVKPVVDSLKPDLTITEAFFELQNPVRIGTPKQGERVRVAVNVKNLGADLTSSQGILNWSVSVQDFAWETNPALSATVVFSPSTPLRTGVHTQFQGWGYFTSSDTKSAFFMVDAGNELAEINEANNSFTAQVSVASTATVNLEKPDLVVEKITLDPPIPLINQPAVVTAWVRNIGAVEAFIPNSYPRTGPTANISVADINYGEGVRGREEPLSPGDMATYVFGSRTPLRFLKSGTYYIQVAVDRDEVIAESNESNNSLTKTVELVAVGKVTDLKHTLNGRVARIFWKTDSVYNCRIVFKGRSDISDDLFSTGAGISVVYTGESNNSAVNLDELSLPNRESDRVFYYRIVCRDKTDGHKVAESEVRKIELSASTPVGTTPPTGTVVQNDPAVAASEEARSFRERIQRLELRISELEQQVVEAEKRLTQRIDRALAQRLKGKILLQVEENGEAWYVDPITQQRFYLKDGQSAYQALQAFGLGIKNSDLEKIPVGLEERAARVDTDGDGLDDRLEEALGTDKNNPDTDGDGHLDGEEVKNLFSPRGAGRSVFDQGLVRRLNGRIVLQVEDRGQAWYIHEGKRYYLKDGNLAYQIMRYLSLGITNNDIRQIGVGELE